MGPSTLPRHPRTGLRALGLGRRGPIWPVMGGDGTGDAGGSGGSGDAGGQGGASGAGSGSGDQGTGGAQGGAQGGSGGAGGTGSGSGDQGGTGQGDQGDQGGAGDGGDDLANLTPAELAKMVRDLRKENGRTRHDAKAQAAADAEAALVQKLGKALGLVKDGDTAPDPDQLAAQLDERAGEARQARVELAVYRAADGAGGDPAALLDSRSFLDRVKDLDPAGDGFAGKLTEAIKAAVRENPKLRAGQAPGSSAANHAGGSGEGGKNQPASLLGAVRSHYGQ